MLSGSRFLIIITSLVGYCGANPLTVTVLSHNGAPLSDMVVYIEYSHNSEYSGSQKKTVIINQVKKAFTPYITVIQAGSSVIFKNQDGITHHVYSVAGSNRFSHKIKAGKSLPAMAFNDPGEIPMGCNIHDWMSSYLLVLNTPWFGKTDKKGNWKINLNNKGRYLVTVWHPQMKEPLQKISRSVDLESASDITVKLTMKMKDIPIQLGDDDFDFLEDY